MNSISIEELLKDKKEELQLELTQANEGLSNKISVPRIQKLGMALTGYTNFLHSDRLQILGKTEITYLKTLTTQEKRERFDKICAHNIVAFVVTRSLDVPQNFIKMAKSYNIPIIKTTLDTAKFISHITAYLEEKFSPTTVIHGVLLEVFGIGTLILGKSGIGKSESALDLVLRGHRLVADDIVNIRRKTPTILFGSGADLIRHNMEIRGLGIINIKDLFGSTSVKDSQKIDLVIQLTAWDSAKEYDRLGLDVEMHTILDVSLPLLNVPVSQGRNMTTIIEVACRNHLLKRMGCHSAQNFERELRKKIDRTGRYE